MANLSGQSLDESGLILTSVSGTQFSFTAQQCKDLFASLGNDLTLLDSQIKGLVVAALGEAIVSADQIRLTFNSDGTISSLGTGLPRA